MFERAPSDPEPAEPDPSPDFGDHPDEDASPKPGGVLPGFEPAAEDAAEGNA